MSTPTFRTSRPNAWVRPRAYTDATLRQNHYGPLQPMADDRPGFWRRLLGAR